MQRCASLQSDSSLLACRNFFLEHSYLYMTIDDDTGERRTPSSERAAVLYCRVSVDETVGSAVRSLFLWLQ